MSLFLNMYWILIGILLNFVCLAKCNVECYESDLEKINEKFLEQSNHYRSIHSADPFTYDKKLASESMKWSRQLAESGQFKHSSAGDYGENLFQASSTKSYDQAMKNTIKSWYDEVKDYKGGFSHGTGHFTQLVWKSSKKMGCGVCTSDKTRTYVTCRYTPAGNVEGSYERNVKPAKGSPTRVTKGKGDKTATESTNRDDSSPEKDDDTRERDDSRERDDTATKRKSNDGMDKVRSLLQIVLYISLVVTLLPIIILIMIVVRYFK